MMQVLAAEFLKLKRSRMPLWTALVVVLVSGLGVALYPALSETATQQKIAANGGVFAKAVAQGLYDATWANYLHISVQGIAGSWGILTFGLVTAYVFGREYSEGTARTLFTLPLRRERIVLAKMAVVAVWVLCLTMLSLLLTMGVAAMLRANGFGAAPVLKTIGESAAVAALFYSTLPLVAWFALLGKGYLRPMLFSFAMMVVQNALLQTSVSRWVPWDMPIHVVGASWYPVPPSPLVASSWMAAAALFLAGLAACVWRVDHADTVR